MKVEIVKGVIAWDVLPVVMFFVFVYKNIFRNDLSFSFHFDFVAILNCLSISHALLERSDLTLFIGTD